MSLKVFYYKFFLVASGYSFPTSKDPTQCNKTKKIEFKRKKDLKLRVLELHCNNETTI